MHLLYWFQSISSYNYNFRSSSSWHIIPSTIGAQRLSLYFLNREPLSSHNIALDTTHVAGGRTERHCCTYYIRWNCCLKTHLSYSRVIKVSGGRNNHKADETRQKVLRIEYAHPLHAEHPPHGLAKLCKHVKSIIVGCNVGRKRSSSNGYSTLCRPVTFCVWLAVLIIPRQPWDFGILIICVKMRQRSMHG